MQLDSELTLEKAVKMVRQQEVVRQQQVDLQRPSTSQMVDQVRFNSRKLSPKQQQHPSGKKEKSAKTRTRCPKCGGFTHREGQACRAEGKRCNLCSKTDHFANSCPDKQAKTAKVKAVSELDEEIAFLLGVSAVEDSSNLDDDEGECRRRWTAEIQVNGKQVKFKLDSQADVTCVPLCLFKTIMGQQRLVESNINLRAAEFSELQTVGMFVSTLRNGSYEIKERIYVICRLSEPLLSRRACELLNLARRIEVVATKIDPIKKFPEVFEGLGQIRSPCEIKLKLGANPYAVHTPRRVPNFARQYGFTHVASSPRFPQSNGMAEAGVKIAKLILKKNQDPSLGLLECRSTPLENGCSPAELLMGHKLRTTLPIAPENLSPGLVDSRTLKRREERRRRDMKSRYDRRCGAGDMEELVKNEKTPAVDYPSGDSDDGQIRTRIACFMRTQSGLFYEMANADQQPLEAPTVEAGVTTGGDAGFDPIPFNPSLNIRKYAGDEDPRQWITSLEEVGFLYRWADYIITRYAAMNLVGPAKTWYEFHKVNLATWEIFKTRLIQDFASLENKDEIMLKLNRMQGWNELAMRFAEDILLQCSKVQPNMEEMEKIQFVIGGNREANDGEYVVEPNEKLTLTNGLRIARCLITVRNKLADLWITNPYPRTLKIMKNQTLGYASPPTMVNNIEDDEEDKVTEIQINEDLTLSQKNELRQVLSKYSDLFSSKLGKTNLAKHRIDTENAKPIKHKPYRVSPKERDIIKEQIQDMLQEGVIRASSGPWAFPVILVRKRDGNWRFCVDYRKLNSITVKDVYPIPRIDDVMDTLQGSRYFTAIDLRSGYWQVEIEEQDKKKTAFTTSHGLYVFNVMPFGLCNAPATFERIMDNVLKNIKWKFCLCYLDDVIIYSPDFTTHLGRIEAVLKCFRESNLRLNGKKCRFGFEEIEILGHVTSKHGIKPADHNVKAIRDFPRPSKTKEIQSFIGLCSYYRKFIKNFSRIADPLFKLTRKDSPFIWSESQEEAFITLKSLLTNPPILSHFDPEAPTQIHTDASNIGLGATLVQTINGQEKVISYISRSLSKPERNYSTTEKECLALVWSMSKLRPYLYGRRFKVMTDHHALCWLRNLRDPTGRLARWALKIQEYDFEIIYKSGKKHLDADGLSRGPLPETDFYDNYDSLFFNPVIEDSDEYIENIKRCLGDTEGKRSIVENFKEENGCLYKRNPRPEGRAWLLVVPRVRRKDILKEHHNHMICGHLGVTRTMHRLKDKYFWPSMLKDVVEYVRTCHLCQSRKGSNQLPAGLLHPIPAANYPFERVGIDFLGPLPSTKNRKKWMIVLTDYYTKYAETKAVIDATAREVAKFLTENVILKHGAPRYMISDRGSQFTSNLVKEITKICQIQHCLTTSYHPQTNGLTERLNRTLINMISMYVNVDQRNWDEILPFITHAYNTTIQETTKYSPFFLLYGREPVSILDDTNIFIEPDSEDYDEYVSKLMEKIVRTRDIVKVNTEKSQAKMINYYNQKHRQTGYEPGDLVALWTPIRKPGKCEKLLRRYFGPYIVLKKISDVNYSIVPEDNSGNRTQPTTVHISRIKPYFARIENGHEDATISEEGEDKIADKLVKALEAPSNNALDAILKLIEAFASDLDIPFREFDCAFMEFYPNFFTLIKNKIMDSKDLQEVGKLFQTLLNLVKIMKRSLAKDPVAVYKDFCQFLVKKDSRLQKMIHYAAAICFDYFLRNVSKWNFGAQMALCFMKAEKKKFAPRFKTILPLYAKLLEDVLGHEDENIKQGFYETVLSSLLYAIQELNLNPRNREHLVSLNTIWGHIWGLLDYHYCQVSHMSLQIAQEVIAAYSTEELVEGLTSINEDHEEFLMKNLPARLKRLRLTLCEIISAPAFNEHQIFNAMQLLLKTCRITMPHNPKHVRRTIKKLTREARDEVVNQREETIRRKRTFTFYGILTENLPEVLEPNLDLMLPSLIRNLHAKSATSDLRELVSDVIERLREKVGEYIFDKLYVAKEKELTNKKLKRKQEKYME
ncbi:hypothetical protein LAZ67_1008247, partial [Cordylochernes scorpioides]